MGPVHGTETADTVRRVRTYRRLWKATATIASAVAFVAGAREAGWPALAATVLWHGLGFGLTEVLLIGLPSLIGAWTLLVVIGLWATSPATAVQLVQEHARLLDEAERRDPKEFDGAWVRAGWRSTEVVVD